MTNRARGVITRPGPWPESTKSRVGKGRRAGSIELRVSPSPSKIPYGGFSPVRLQTDRQRRPSTSSQGLSAVPSRPMTRLIRHRSCGSLPGTRDPRRATRSRTSRFNVARPPATPTRPSRGPWLAIGLWCPAGSSLTMASSEPLNPSPPLMDSRWRLLHPRKIGLRWESRDSAIYSAGLVSRAASLTPVAPKSANDCCFLFGLSLHLPVTGSAITLVVSRLQSSLRAYSAHVTARELASPPFEDVSFDCATQVTLNQRRI